MLSYIFPIQIIYAGSFTATKKLVFDPKELIGMILVQLNVQ
jgi:hypothetical protein